MSVHWTPAEVDYLNENWGMVSIPTLCKKLERSETAVILKVRRLGLPSFLESGDYVTVNQLFKTFVGYSVSKAQIDNWKSLGLPTYRKKVGKNSFQVINLPDFWKWAEKNRTCFDFSRLEPLSLGAEPAWVAEQRSKDYRHGREVKSSKWTPQEDRQLLKLVKANQYGLAEVAAKMCRSEGAIERRLSTLSVKERPVKAKTHGPAAAWTDKHLALLADGIRHCDNYRTLSATIGKSEKAVRGRVFTVYFTENLDRVREMLGSGAWGTGAPPMDVKHAVYLSHTRKAVRADLTSLAQALQASLQKAELLETQHSDYWQHRQCSHWNTFTGCTAYNGDCDSCPNFKRK